MTGNELIKWIQDWGLGERHVQLQVRTKHGNFQKPFFGLSSETPGELCLTAGEEYEGRPQCIPSCLLNATGRTVKPLPSCPYVGTKR